MILQSCSNCWYNGLQYGSIGLTVGYCTEHNVLLRQSDETTCGLHRRKDLLLASALRVSAAHRERYSSKQAVRLDGAQWNGDIEAYLSEEIEPLQQDQVGSIVTEYEMGAKIEALAQLRQMGSVRAELARLSLARAYVDRCVSRDKRWHSGLHLLWWTKESIAEAPRFSLDDFRSQYPVSMQRQLELESWSLIMLRLTFIADMAVHALVESESSELGRKIGRRVQALSTLPEEAAEAASTTLIRLLRWVAKHGVEKLNKALPLKDYRSLSAELHKERTTLP